MPLLAVALQEKETRTAAAAGNVADGVIASAVAGGSKPQANAQPPPSRAHKVSSFAAGPKPSEVYGFVKSITTVIATAVYLVWAYTPEPYLHSLGITYYPSKYWALAVPSLVMVAVALSMVIYMGFNFLATPPPTSFNTIFDEHTRERTMFSPAMEAERPIEPISDISVDQINNLMFCDG